MTLAITDSPVPLRTDSDGIIRIGGTRVTLDSVVAAFTEGATAEEIVHQYSSLDLADVYAVISYYLRRQKDVDEYLRSRAVQAQTVRNENESRFDTHGIRERLVARSKSTSTDLRVEKS